MTVNSLIDNIEPIAHGNSALSNLASQFLGKENIEKLLTVVGDELDEAEDMLYSLTQYLNIDSAVDAQLDVIGIRLNLSRDGRSDGDYRTALYDKIGLNLSNGTPEDVIVFTQAVINNTNIKYEEFYPARIRVTIYDAFPTILSLEQLRQLKPAGVGPMELLSWGAETAVFSFSSIDGPTYDPSPYAEGFGTTDDPLLGGVCASIYEVVS